MTAVGYIAALIMSVVAYGACYLAGFYFLDPIEARRFAAVFLGIAGGVLAMHAANLVEDLRQPKR